MWSFWEQKDEAEPRIYKSRRDEATGQEALVPVPPRAHCAASSACKALIRHFADIDWITQSQQEAYWTISKQYLCIS